MPAHPPAAPVAMLGEQQAHLRDLRFANESTLNDAKFEHNPDHGGEKRKSSEKNETIFLGKISLQPRPTSATMQIRSNDLNSYAT